MRSERRANSVAIITPMATNDANSARQMTTSRARLANEARLP